MFVFGHAGITLGTAIALNGLLNKRHHTDINVNVSEAKHQPSVGITLDPNTLSMSSRLRSLVNSIDIRLLMFGSLIPDIIDKPVGQFFFRDTFSNGRIFCHTLLFLILITLGGLYLYYTRKKKWLLILSFGCLTHLILDAMWLNPKTLFWPLYGFSFERLELNYWSKDLLHNLLNNPLVWIPELVGISLISWFLWYLFRKGAIRTFIFKGHI